MTQYTKEEFERTKRDLGTALGHVTQLTHELQYVLRRLDHLESLCELESKEDHEHTEPT